VPKELVEAPASVLDLIVEQAVLPCLVRVEKDLAVPLRVSVRQGVAPNRIVRSVNTPSPPAGDFVDGDAQVNTRMNYGGDRFIFRVFVVFPSSLSPKTGFSGFNVPGSVAVVEGGYRLTSDSWTVAYNDWELKDWV
jgi:hypothetical protein